MLSRRRALFQSNQSRPLRPWDYPAVLEYWDARSGVTSSGERVSAWAGRKGFATLEQATGANQPILLPYSGTNYLWMPGVNGNNATAPDSGPLSITGDIDIRLKLSMDDWTPTGDVDLLGKWAGSGQASYFLTNAAGNLRLYWSADGSVAMLASSTTTTGIADYAAKWIRATMDVNDGVGNRVINFYLSDDGITWTKLGNTVTAAGTTSIFNGTAVVSVAAWTGSSSQGAGKIYRAQIYDGIDGTLVFDANFSAVSEGATSFTESSSNAATVTINSTGSKPAQIVGSQQVLFDGSAYYMATGALTLNQPETVLFCGKQVTWTTSDTIYDGNSVNTMRLYQTGTTPQVNLYAGASAAPNTDWAVGANAILSAVYNGASSSLGVNLNTRTTGNASTGNGGGLYLGASAGPTGYGNTQCKALTVCNSALSTEQLTALIASINRYHSVF